MPTQAPPSSLPQLMVQGIPVPSSSMNPDEFFRRTRRQRIQMAAPVSQFAGLGNTDSVSLRKTGILAALDLKFEGSLVVVHGTGSAASTFKWPLDLAKNVRVSANGQSNLINCSGAKLRARQLMSYPGLTDRGVIAPIGGSGAGTNVQQGTLLFASESPGVGTNVTAIPSGTYPVSLTYRIPIAWDLVKLFGALFLQTSATTVDLAIDWSPLTDLFTITGNDTVTLTGGWTVEGILYTVPQINGQPIIPDLTSFHTLVQSQITNIGQTTNEPLLPGQGVGKQLMRFYGQLWTGSAAPGAPLSMTAANFGQIGWRYGGNETPEQYTDGNAMRRIMEEFYGSDLGTQYGFFCVDFASHWAFRDSVNEGDATELRVLLQVLASLGSTVRLELVREEMISGAIGS